jgi:photosystem II stability/assembly factor-like uncharacterized protein
MTTYTDPTHFDVTNEPGIPPTPTPTCVAGLYLHPTQVDRYWTNIVCDATGTNLAATAFGSFIFLSNDTGKTWRSSNDIRNWSGITMSKDSSKLAAITILDYIYISRDQGLSWSEFSGRRNWSSICCSYDMSTIAATASNDKIYISRDGGFSWTATGQNKLWKKIVCNYNASLIVAVAYEDQIYSSQDYGQTWVGNNLYKTWTSIACASDGSTFIATTYNDHIYVSTNNGQSWDYKEQKRDWTSASSSSDGEIIAATTNMGYVYISTNSGLSWSPLANKRQWIGSALSSNGLKLHAAAYEDKIYISDCEASPTPTPISPYVRNSIVISDPFVSETQHDYMAHAPSQYNISLPDQFTITIDQDKNSIKTLIDSNPTHNSNLNFCKINTKHIIDIKRLKKNFTKIAYLNNDNFSVNNPTKSTQTSKIYLDIDCMTGLSKPRYPDKHKFEIIYFWKGIDAFPNIDGYTYDCRMPSGSAIRLYSTSSSRDVRNWLIGHFKFMNLNATTVNSIGYIDLYWTYSKDTDTVYINVIPS